MSGYSKLAGVVVVVAVFCLGVIEVEAAIVVQTGFNDAVGINPSDYTNGGGLNGKGSGEPGWTTTWNSAKPTYFNTTSSPTTEGDLALKIHTVPGSSTVLATRKHAEQTGLFYVDTMLQATSSLRGLGFIMYTIDESGGVATMINLPSDGNVKVSDKTTPDYVFVDTGYDWTAGQWVRVTQEIDTPNKTYRAWVDGKPFDPAPTNPLNFRSSDVTGIDKVQLFLWQQAASTQTVRVDELRYLTHNPLTAIPLTGFEASEGYVNNQTVIGQGDGEHGWTSAWEIFTGRNNGTAIVQSAVKRSGEQALEMTSVGSPDMMIHRHYEVQNQLFSLEFDVLIDGPFVQGLHLYAGNSSGTGFNMSFETDYDISARDGGTLEDTGFNWAVDEWTHVTALIDPESQTYELLINGVKYNAPDPLDFRNSPTYIDDFRILLLSQGTSGPSVFFDNIMINVPEPASLALLVSAAFGLLLPMRRRRGK